MARSQPAVPQRSRVQRPVRRFTLEQANRSLPLVKRIVGDVVQTHSRGAELQQRIESLPKASKEQPALQSQLESALERLHGLVEELTEVGCELKDPQTGLIDFVGRHQGRDVHLCWRLGEDHITHWHELDAGFAGRQPVSTLEEDKK